MNLVVLRLLAPPSTPLRDCSHVSRMLRLLFEEFLGGSDNGRTFLSDFDIRTVVLPTRISLGGFEESLRCFPGRCETFGASDCVSSFLFCGTEFRILSGSKAGRSYSDLKAAAMGFRGSSSS